MKKMTKLFVSTAVLAGIAAAPMTTLAADGGVYHSEGAITFKPSEDPTDPVDPTDPETPVEPEGPHEPGTNGPLSIDFASSFDFGTQNITSTNQTYYAAAQKYKVVGEDGKPTGDIQEGPNYVQVTDNRGTESGWTLQVTQDAQFKGTGTHELAGAVITLSNGNIVTKSESAKPSGAAEIVLTPGTAANVMVAADKQGAGTYLNDWGTDKDTGAKSVSLMVPGKITKYTEKYTTQLTWTLTDVPGNGGSETPEG